MCNKENTIIGPFLGASSKIGEVRIFIGLPKKCWENIKNINKITCKIIPEDAESNTVTFDNLDKFGICEFKFEALEVGKRYKYKFYLDDSKCALDLQGLSEDDCQFTVPKHDENSSFLLLSCHNPLNTDSPFGNSPGSPFSMWEDIYELLYNEKNNIELIVMMGDQVYCDDVENKYKCSRNIDLDEFFIDQYLKYWEDVRYRRVLSNIPSIVIWDDHDITDGWGSREEFLEKDYQVKKIWKDYYEAAKNIYKKYQHIRNDKKIDSTLSHFFDLGSSRIFLLDLRSERNFKKNQVMSENHKKEFFNKLKDTKKNNSIKNVFVVLSVIPFRTNMYSDERLTDLMKCLDSIINRNIKSNKNNNCIKLLWKRIKHTRWCEYIVKCIKEYCLCYILILTIIILFSFNYTISSILMILFSLLILVCAIKLKKHLPIASLTDDIQDGLSSLSNRGFLSELLENLFKFEKQSGKKVYILSGDIHLGGITEILECSNNYDNKSGSVINNSILQIVSSPISNLPMNKPTAGFTTTTSPMRLENGIYARNIFYISKRNFVKITPKFFEEGSDCMPIEFYLEGHTVPIAFHGKFYNKDDSE